MNTSLRLSLAIFLSITALAACDTVPAPHPDYRVKLSPLPGGHGMLAVPPECPSWTTVANGPGDNIPWPQYGCAHARNMAAMVDRPEDMIAPNGLGPADATATAAAVDRYRAGKTKPLADPNAQAPVTIATPTTESSPK